MKSFIVVAIAGIVLMFAVLPTVAHHSTSGLYDETRTVQVTGKVVEWRLVNPHPYLIVEIAGSNGEVELWDLSFGGSAVSHLLRQGYSAQSFKIGEIINARGNPARSESVHGILIRGGLTREDGSAIP